MANEKKTRDKKGLDGGTLLISFLAGAAIGVGLILFAESKTGAPVETTYGDADLFV
jgi:hypothetical protein